MGRQLTGSRQAARWLALLLIGLSPLTQAAEPEALFAPFAELLDSAVKEGQVDYPAFAASDEFRAMIGALGDASLPRTASDDETLAAYINAYNALSIQGIVDGFSPTTVWSRLKFFKRREYRVFSRSLTLYELEHNYIIAAGDARIHFAIVCASQSCPPLKSTLYRGETLDAQLDSVTRAFINDTGENAFDVEQREARVSRLFKWYDDEFAASAGSLAQFLARYVSDPAVRDSLLNEAWSFDYRDYDWSLNGTPLER